MTDNLDKISAFTGLKREDLVAIVAEAKENIRKLRACKRHRFAGGQTVLGQKHVCFMCGGHVDNGFVGAYIEGYEAAGGKADDIWPGYRDVRSPGA